MSYKIIVKTLQGNILTFSVNKYEVEPGDIIKFKDSKKNRIKRFHSSQCEINEEKNIESKSE